MYIDSSMFLYANEYDSKFNCFIFDGKDPGIFEGSRKELIEKLIDNEYVLVETSFKSDDENKELSREHKGVYYYGVGNIPYRSDDSASVLERLNAILIDSDRNYIAADIAIKYSKDKRNLNSQKNHFIDMLKRVESTYKHKTLFIEIAEKSTQNNEISSYILKMIDKHLAGDVKIVLKNYYGSLYMINDFIKRGYYFLVTPQIIDNTSSGEYFREVIKNVPVENILSSSFSPYVSLNSDFINYISCNNEDFNDVLTSPFVLPFVIQKISELKGLSFDDTKETVNKNAIKAFDLKITKYIDNSTKEKLHALIEDVFMETVKDNDFFTSLFPIEHNNNICYITFKDDEFCESKEIYYLLLPKDKDFSKASFAMRLFGNEMSSMKYISKEQFYKAFINYELKKISFDEELDDDYYQFLLSKFKEKLEWYNFRGTDRRYYESYELPEVPVIPD